MHRVKKVWLAKLVIVVAGLIVMPSVNGRDINTGHNAPALHIRLGTETVGDKVNYTPNLRGGGFANPVQRSRYSAQNFAVEWVKNDRHRFQAGLSGLQFTSLRDRFELIRLSFGSFHTLAGSNAGKSNVLEFKVASNFSRQIHKNSFTQINDNLITGLTIDRPGDLVLQTGLTHTRALTDNSRWSVVGAFGHIQTRNKGLSGEVSSNGCQYQFDLDNSGGQLRQIDSCGSIQALTRRYPDDVTVEQDLGVSPQRDTQYRATFVGAGVSYAISRSHWSAQLSFYHQQYFRPAIDQRIVEQGRKSYDQNQTITAELTRSVTPRLSLSAELKYNHHQFLDIVPVLYSGVTAHRFSNDVVLLALQARYAIE